MASQPPPKWISTGFPLTVSFPPGAAQPYVKERDTQGRDAPSLGCTTFKSEEGEDVAWDIIRIRLQEIVDKEDKAAPLSDDDLVEELKKLGLTVARRTVTKYRQKMNIPSSRQRRDWAKTSPADNSPSVS